MTRVVLAMWLAGVRGDRGCRLAVAPEAIWAGTC